VPVAWIGSPSWVRWLRIGLPGQSSHGPHGLRLRATEMECPYDVPPSATIR
jgi:hypothetical protein